jgi:trk system potassium uptake protein TrkA
MHVIVAGCGRVGSTIARRLAADGHDVVVVDRRADAFTRLGVDFPGRTITGVGFDRDVLTEAAITPGSAVLAVTSGDNSNILIARVARETFKVDRVVARIYDPNRASIYERLGIPTVASVAWTSGRAIGEVMPDSATAEWTDPTSSFALVEHRVPAAAAGHAVAEVDEAGVRIALITRAGRAQLPTPTTLLQQDDVLHIVGPTRQQDGPAPVADVLQRLGGHRS